MKLALACIGRLKRGPELELVQRYDKRLKAARAQGITGITTHELPEARAGDAPTRKRDEAQALRRTLGEATPFISFDERGKPLDSRAFASLITDMAERGTATLGVVIGGPDGLDETMRADAHRVVSFGALTLPHQLVRVLVMEQLYRATTIMAGHPYHRD